LNPLTSNEASAVTEFVFFASLKIAETEHRFCSRKPANSLAWRSEQTQEEA
jgi:hypothetical protein